MADTVPAVPATDSALFADPAFEPPCEHPDHGTDSPFHRDGDPHYVMFGVSCGHIGPPPNTVVTVCGHWVHTIRAFLCIECGACYGAELMTVLGRVSDFR